MANQKISQYSALTKSTVDVADVLPIVDTSASATKKITYADLIVPLDSQFGVSNASDATKVARFSSSAITTGTTRTYTLPDASVTLVGDTNAVVMTNKTFTSPQINFGSDAPGDIIIRNGSGVTSRLGLGSNGQILQSNGTTAAWVSNPAAANGSTSVSGVYQKATTADITAGTTTGTTGALLVIGADAVGTAGANKIVQLNSSSQLPAVDGSLLTNISTSFKNGTSTPTISASTTVFAHGLGRVPKFAHFSIIYQSTFTILHIHGSYTPSAQGCVFIADKGSSGSSPITGLSSTAAIFIGSSGNGSSVTNSLSGVVSVDATNITITWTTAGSPGTPTINLEWEAQ